MKSSTPSLFARVRPALIALSAALCAVTVMPVAALAHAPVETVEERDEGLSAFDRDVALGVYYSSWHGAYESQGAGFRLRWEPIDELGIEVYAEILSVDVPNATRMDIPAGFSLYVPIELFEGFRVRPLAGLCTMFSFVNDDTIAGGSADDILFGLHVGAGLELAVMDHWSIFVDGTYQTYFGHARNIEEWSAAVGRSIDGFEHFQVGAGVQFHL